MELFSRDVFRHWEVFLFVFAGMSAGDSTLNALTALQTMKTMQEADPGAKLSPVELRGRVMENYVKFMTNPGKPDSYASRKVDVKAIRICVATSGMKPMNTCTRLDSNFEKSDG